MRPLVWIDKKESNWGRYLTLISSIHKVICMCPHGHIHVPTHTHIQPYTFKLTTLHTYINTHIKTLKIIHYTLHRQKATMTKNALLPETHSRKHMRQLSACILVVCITTKCPEASSTVIGAKRCSREKSCLVKCIWEMYGCHPLLEGHLAGWHNKGSKRKTMACSEKNVILFGSVKCLYKLMPPLLATYNIY